MTPQTRTRQRSARGEGDVVRDEILDAAEALLLEHGHPDHVGMRAVADAVGVSPPTIYRHFADKDTLLFEVCSRRFDDLEAELLEASADLPEPVERLEAMGRAYVAFGLERQEAYRVLFGEKVEIPEGVDIDALAGLRSFRLLVDVLQEGIDAGAFVTADPWETAVAIWAAIHGLVMIVATTPDWFPLPPEEAMVDRTLRLVMEGILTR